jgi:hypothetical protein
LGPPEAERNRDRRHVVLVRPVTDPPRARRYRRRKDVATEEDAQMLSGDMARFQIADRVREAEAERRARSTRRSKAADERGFTRRVGRAAIAAVIWPVRH